MAHFEGIIPAVTTPFDASGAVDEAALERNVCAYLDAGVHGIVANGTMGEAGSLSAEPPKLKYRDRRPKSARSEVVLDFQI